ncbi:hypothetical protein OKW35_008033 [Paraburkholderia sp. MM5477-R1]
MLQTLAITLRLLAKRWVALEEELKTLDAMLEKLTNQYACRLRGRFGVGPHTAATLVTVAGDNPERLKMKRLSQHFAERALSRPHPGKQYGID